MTRTDHLGREHKAGTASLSIEPFELSRLRGGCTVVVWVLNAVLVLGTRFEGANYADKSMVFVGAEGWI